MTQSIVKIPVNYFGEPNLSRTISNGSIYVGVPGEDPEIIENRYTIYAQNEDGTQTPITPANQPVTTSSGGYPQYNGSVAQILVGDGNTSTTTDYSIKVLDKYGDQAFYFPSVLAGQTGAGGSSSVLNFDTLADAAASDSISNGDALNIKGRISGNVGGAFWDVTQTSLVTPNGLNIVQCTTLTYLSLVLRSDVKCTASQFGLLAGGSDQYSETQSFIGYCNDNNLELRNDISDLNCQGGELSLYSNMTIKCVEEGQFNNTTMVGEGSLGTEIGLTADSDKGTNIINAPSASFLVGDVLFIKSCINCLSSDAGDDRLGSVPGGVSYFAEFVTVSELNGSSITIEENLIFDYTITPGDFSAGRTNSTVAKVDFIENINFVDCKFFGRADSDSRTINLSYARNINRNNVQFETDDRTNYFEWLWRCYKCSATNYKVNRDPNPSNSSQYNSFLTLGSQDCNWDGVGVTGGFQAVDFTYDPTIEEANPSVNCRVDNGWFYNVYDGMTTHPGVFGCGGTNLHCFDSENGFRLRSPYGILSTFTVEKRGTPTGFGLFFEDGYNYGTDVSDGIVSGCTFGIQAKFYDETSEPATNKGNCSVNNITAIECLTGMHLLDQPANNLPCNFVSSNFKAFRCNNIGVSIGDYNNSVTLLDTTVVGPFGDSARAGIEWGLNIANLTIDGFKSINMSDIYGLRGPSASSFITDTTTFPGGNAEAFLSISGTKFVGQTAGFETLSIIEDSTAFSENLSGIGTTQQAGSVFVRDFYDDNVIDVFQYLRSDDRKMFSVAQDGMLDGAVPNDTWDAVTNATTLDELKDAIKTLVKQGNN